jgi:hypothetical protein
MTRRSRINNRRSYTKNRCGNEQLNKKVKIVRGQYERKGTWWVK